MPTSVPPAIKFMRFQFTKGVSHILALILLLTLSCKKETIEVSVDAFSQLNTEVKSDQGVYQILFTLQPYPYSEVGVRISKSKDSFYKNTGLGNFYANKVSPERYGTFINGLDRKTTYYYQIYVKDSSGPKEVHSDVYSFQTIP